MRKIKSRSGVALMTVVLFFLVLVILLGGLQFISLNNLKNTQTTQKHTSVYYIAESGINLQVAKFMDLFQYAIDNNWTDDQFNDAMLNLRDQINGDENLESFKDNLGNSANAIISISGPNPDSDFPGYFIYTIESIGTISDISRTLTADIRYKYEVGDGVIADIEGAIITNGSIHIQNGIVKGAVASNLDDGATFTIREQIETTNCESINTDNDGNEIIGITLPLDSISPCIDDFNDIEEGKKIIFSDIVLPTYPTSSQITTDYINLNSSTLYTAGKLTLPDPGTKSGYVLTNLTPNQNYTIDLGNWMDSNEYVILRITNTMSFSRSYTVTGTGKLMLLLNHNSNLTIPQSARINQNSDDPTKFLIVLKSNASNPTFTIHQNAIVVASILSDSTADLSLPARGFFGFIASNAGYNDYVGTVNITANSQIGSINKPPIWIYAPYAHVAMSGNSYFYGTIMSNSFTMNASGSHLIYKTPTYNYPFSEWTPLPTIDNGSPAETSLEFVITPIKEN